MNLNLDRSAWKRVRLHDVVRRSRTQVDPLDAGIDRYVAGGHIDGDSMTITRWGDPTDGQMGSTFRYVFEPGQILFVSARPYLRKFGVVDFSGVVADKTYVLDAIPENGLLQEFLPFLLASVPFLKFANAQATGSMNPRLLWGPLQRYEVDLPPIAEQKRIADLLWAIEGHRSALMEAVKSVHKAGTDWFDQALARDGSKPLPVTELVLAGPTNGKSARANDEGRGVPTLSISAIRGGRVLGGEYVKYIDVPTIDVRKFVIEDDDFLVVRGNGNKQLTGRGGLANGGLPEGCIYPDLLIRLRFDPKVILPAFAAAQWNGAAAHAALLQSAKSTNGIWKINGQDVKSQRLATPPINEQLRILEKLAAFDRATAAIQSEQTTLATLQASVLSDIFGGN